MSPEQKTNILFFQPPERNPQNFPTQEITMGKATSPHIKTVGSSFARKCTTCKRTNHIAPDTGKKDRMITCYSCNDAYCRNCSRQRNTQGIYVMLSRPIEDNRACAKCKVKWRLETEERASREGTVTCVGCKKVHPCTEDGYPIRTTEQLTYRGSDGERKTTPYTSDNWNTCTECQRPVCNDGECHLTCPQCPMNEAYCHDCSDECDCCPAGRHGTWCRPCAMETGSACFSARGVRTKTPTH